MVNKHNTSAPDTESKDVIDIAKLIGTIIDYRWLIIGVTAFFSLISIVYVIFAQPQYQANAVVQVEKNASSSLLNDISEMLPNAQPASNTEIELITSRMVIDKVTRDLGLETSITEKHFPLIGDGWARLTKQKPSSLKLSQFDIDSMYMGQPFTFQVGENGTYTLTTPAGDELKGKVGQPISGNGVKINVSKIDAESGTSFDINKNTVLNIYKSIFPALTVLDNSKDSGVLHLSLVGSDPVLTEQILDRITRNYLEQNIERKSEEAAKSLAFLKEQLPLVRNSLDTAENNLNLYRRQHDTVDLPLEARSVLDSIVAVDTQLNELTFKEADVSKLYTKEHPTYRALLEKRATLEEEKRKYNQRVSEMPGTQQEIIKLTRDVDSGQAIYMQLLNKQQELNINKASTVGNVRIIDPAQIDPTAVSPRKAMIVVLMTVVGAMLAMTVVIIKSILHRGIENPDLLEERGMSVYANIPVSEWQKTQDRELINTLRLKRVANRSAKMLAIGNPSDLAMEAIRSLRTSIHFALVEAENNIVMISGASPSSGKTFVSSNLAAAMAQSDKKILFIDADMRKGYSHEIMNVKNENGLSELLSNQTDYAKAIKTTEVPNLDLIPRGKVPPNPSELLMRPALKELLEWAQKNYDLIIIDTPPILAVTDAAIISKIASTALLVARFGVNTAKEMELCVKRFEHNGTEIKGVILNAVEKKASGYYGEYGYYSYNYESSSK
ncbi:polysaccharide biosynthesis tyrosine autokinase [Pantoea sp. B65]|uniref:polysaccharide biosynthesis tyrosine autokinase n=1 Tax=Pantoea sp. B65 TaxID=2813359 RepID=UPI0039B372CF